MKCTSYHLTSKLDLPHCQFPGIGPQSRPVSRGPGMMGAQKSLPPTPALTPAMQHRQTGVTPAMAIQSAMVGNSMMQQGMAVGPGEIPNGAGPFVNGGLHNTSDDSIMMGSSASNRVGKKCLNMKILTINWVPGELEARGRYGEPGQQRAAWIVQPTTPTTCSSRSLPNICVSKFHLYLLQGDPRQS